jgi:hypothetical protein
MQSLELSSSGVSQTSSGARGGIMYAQRCVVVGIMLATLGGCVALEVGPQRAFPLDEQVALVHAYEDNAQFPPPGLGNEAYRNEFVTARMYAMDFEYSVYFSKLTNQLQSGDLALDVATLALNTAATALVPPATKTALSASATVVGGARTAIDKDVLVSNTIQILQSQMETSRNHVRARILGNLQSCSNAQYTVWQALTDLEDYYRAGTLPGALEALAAATGNNSQQSKDLKNGTNQSSGPAPSLTRSQTSQGAPVQTLAAPAGQQGNGACQATTTIMRSSASLAAQLRRQ